MRLSLLPDSLSVCRLSPQHEVPSWAWERRHFLSVTYTTDELSIVCSTDIVPTDVSCERDWRAFKVLGPLDFSLTGLLTTLANPLAVNDIPIFAISTFDTDYILVKEPHVSRARKILEQQGHTFDNQVGHSLR
ncbi:MAG: ACT domain-containing protein [Ktedonobacteraceae bacterium]|nr:ACT domain-containing protein [Ktedonobacteraceae bacterium]